MRDVSHCAHSDRLSQRMTGLEGSPQAHRKLTIFFSLSPSSSFCLSLFLSICPAHIICAACLPILIHAVREIQVHVIAPFPPRSLSVFLPTHKLYSALLWLLIINFSSMFCKFASDKLYIVIIFTVQPFSMNHVSATLPECNRAPERTSAPMAPGAYCKRVVSDLTSGRHGVLKRSKSPSRGEKDALAPSWTLSPGPNLASIPLANVPDSHGARVCRTHTSPQLWRRGVGWGGGMGVL